MRPKRRDDKETDEREVETGILPVTNTLSINAVTGEVVVVPISSLIVNAREG